MILLDYIDTKKFAKRNKITKTRVLQYRQEGRIKPEPVKIGNSFAYFKDAKILKKPHRGKGKKWVK